MKIGIDASCWMNRRGFGRYARELVRALLDLDRRNEYRLFLDAETAGLSHDLPGRDRAERIVVQTSRAAARAASASGHRAWGDLWRMTQAVRRHGRDLDIFFFPSVYTFYPLRTRARVAVTLHDTTAERYPHLIFPRWRGRFLWGVKTRWALRQADLIVTVSETAKRDLMGQFGLRETSVRVVPDAVDPAFRPLGDAAQARRVVERYGVPGAGRFVLYVGGISPHKNLETLLEAFAALARDDRFGDVRLVLLGDFTLDVFYSSYPAIRDRVERVGLRGRVVFTGFVPDADLVWFYNAAHVLVLPSLAEGFGLPALEAMACGTPVAVSRAGALPEVVGDAGLFFDPHAPGELADRLRALLDDAALRRDLGARGMRRASRYSWDLSARQALAAFDELVRPA